jgi:hypothetical protein
MTVTHNREEILSRANRFAKEFADAQYEMGEAHQQLDKAVDAAYAYKGPPDDASRVAFLFGLYEQMTSAFTNLKKYTVKKITSTKIF